MYKNTYLEKMSEFYKKIYDFANDIEKIIKELTDGEKIKEMFRGDVEFIMNKFQNGDISESDALNNLDLLRTYVLLQLDTHHRRIVEVLEALERKIMKLKKEVSDGVVDETIRFIVDTINRARLELK